MKSRHIAALLASIAFTINTPSAQLPDRLDNALRALQERNEFGGDNFGPARWVEEGRRYTTLTREKR